MTMPEPSDPSVLEVQCVATMDPMTRTLVERYRWRHPSVRNNEWSRLYVSFAAARSSAWMVLKHLTEKATGAPVPLQMPLDPAAALAAIKKAAADGNVRMAESDGVDAMRAEVEQVLRALGGSDKQIARAFISDRSSVSDLASIAKDRTVAEWLVEASQKLGVIVERDDYIVDVARRLRAKGSK
jgi:hypothetical protein